MEDNNNNKKSIESLLKQLVVEKQKQTQLIEQCLMGFLEQNKKDGDILTNILNRLDIDLQIQQQQQQQQQQHSQTKQSKSIAQKLYGPSSPPTTLKKSSSPPTNFTVTSHINQPKSRPNLENETSPPTVQSKHVTPSSISENDSKLLREKLEIIITQQNKENARGNKSIESYNWGNSNEINNETSGSILKFLNDNFATNNDSYKWLGVHGINNILNVGGSGFNISGSVDYILAHQCDIDENEQIKKKKKEDGSNEFNNIIVLVEIKKDLNDSKFQRQSYLEFLAASSFNKIGLIHVLTDLKECWDITYWSDAQNVKTLHCLRDYASSVISDFIYKQIQEQEQEKHSSLISCSGCLIFNDSSSIFKEEKKLLIKKEHLLK